MAVKLLKYCRYPQDRLALICINHVLRRNGRAGTDWGFVMSRSAWVPALCQSGGSGGLGLYLCIQIKMKPDQTSSCLEWLSLSRVIFFSFLTCAIMCLSFSLWWVLHLHACMLIHLELMLFTRCTRGNNRVKDLQTFPSYPFKLQSV